MSVLLVILPGGVPTTAVGADGEVPKLLASTVMNNVAAPTIEFGEFVDCRVLLPVDVTLALIAPMGMTIRTVPGPGAF